MHFLAVKSGVAAGLRAPAGSTRCIRAVRVAQHAQERRRACCCPRRRPGALVVLLLDSPVLWRSEQAGAQPVWRGGGGAPRRVWRAGEVVRRRRGALRSAGPWWPRFHPCGTSGCVPSLPLQVVLMLHPISSPHGKVAGWRTPGCHMRCRAPCGWMGMRGSGAPLAVASCNGALLTRAYSHSVRTTCSSGERSLHAPLLCVPARTAVLCFVCNITGVYGCFQRGTGAAAPRGRVAAGAARSAGGSVRSFGAGAGGPPRRARPGAWRHSNKHTSTTQVSESVFWHARARAPNHTSERSPVKPEIEPHQLRQAGSSWSGAGGSTKMKSCRTGDIGPAPALPTSGGAENTFPCCCTRISRMCLPPNSAKVTHLKLGRRGRPHECREAM